jgi:tartrate-resistant acid phosphatase type 5
LPEIHREGAGGPQFRLESAAKPAENTSMRPPKLLGPAIALGVAACAVLCRGDEPSPVPAAVSPIEALAARLPPDIGDAARKWLNEDDKDLKAARAFSPASLEQEVMVDLASNPDAAEFVLGRMANEPAKTDFLILKVIDFDHFWPDTPGILQGLQKLAETTTDPDLMLAYLDAERRMEVKHLRKLLTERIEDARKAGDTATLQSLAAADERWIVTERGASIPGFLRKPPAVFSVKPHAQPVRIVGMGDFGSGAQAQRDVAAAIVRMGKTAPFDFGLTFGDNFYPSGMTSPEDSRWRDWWESLYGPLGIVFYPTLGNHEWYADDGAVAEIIYHSPTWRFPSPYYTFTAGPVQFFAIDTTEISEAEVLWLDQAIRTSTAHWKVVYGHHPIFAPERNLKSGSYMKYMQARLWPLLKGRVDAYLCGHQHAMAHMDPHDGVHFFMSGGGGASLSRVAKKDPGALFAESTFGFLTLEANPASMTIAIFDTDGKPFDSEVITK